MIDINELQKLTADAIRRGEIAKVEAKARKDKEEAARVKAAELWVEKVVTALPSKLEDAATDGKYHLTVANIKEYDATNGRLTNRTPPSLNLSGQGLKYHYLVKTLKDLGFKVDIKFAHDGVGIKSWYNIVIDWDPRRSYSIKR